MATPAPSNNTQTPRIFVSHSHKDDAFTRKFADDLRKTGAYVWVDMHDIRDGDFLKRINEGLAKCDWLVLVETPHSLASDAVEMEVNAAQNRVLYGQMRGVIRLVAAARDPRTVQPLWATLQYYDATTDYPAAFAALLTAIRAGDADYARHATATNATGGYAHSPASTLASAPIPADALPASLAQLPQRIADAYNASDWHAVADRSDLLLSETSRPATLDLYRMRGRAFLELSRPNDACQALEAALKLDPLDLPTMRALARIYAQLKRYADAAPLLKKADALADDPTRLDILREYVPVLQAQNDWNEVLSRTAEALFLRRDDPAWLAVRLDALTHLGRPADALAIARQLAVRPDATAADQLARARAAFAANDPGEAARAVLAASKLAPEDPALAKERQAIFDALDDTAADEALAEMRTLADIHTRRGQLREAAQVYKLMADICWGSGEQPEALNLLRQAMQYSTDDMSLRQQFVQYCLETGRTSDASEQQIVIARFYFASRQTKEAVAALQQLIGMEPHNYEAYDLLGQTYYSVGEYEQAARVYRNLAKVNPNSQMARARLQELQSVRGQLL